MVTDMCDLIHQEENSKGVIGFHFEPWPEDEESPDEQTSPKTPSHKG
jgi:hypothetical protein